MTAPVERAYAAQRDLPRELAGLRRFVFLTLPNYSMIACANAVEAQRMANRIAGEEVYTWDVVAPDDQPVAASNGLSLHPTVGLEMTERPDLLLACGGVDVRHLMDRRVTAALRCFARDGVALGALCTGSFALAKAGLLEGYRCAIHWEDLTAIREEFPGVRFVEDVFAFDRDRATCSGGVAPLDMMLAMIEARAVGRCGGAGTVLGRSRPCRGGAPAHFVPAARRRTHAAGASGAAHRRRDRDADTGGGAGAGGATLAAAARAFIQAPSWPDAQRLRGRMAA